MRMLISLFLLLASIPCRSQEIVSRTLLDSIKNVEKSHIGKEFPNFEVKDASGIYFNKASLIGKITLINFWFKDCAPCIAEFEALNNVFQKFGSDSTFKLISFTFEDTPVIHEVTKKYSLQFQVIPISREECYRLNLNSGFPVNIIIGKDGKIAFFSAGGPVQSKDAFNNIDTTIVPCLNRLLKNSP